VSDASEKTFEATPRRLARAKRQGNVARSGELAANCSFGAAGFAVAAIAKLFAATASDALWRAASMRPLASCGPIVAIAVIPICFAVLAGAIVSVVQMGGLVLAPIVVKTERLNPVEGVRRILSRETVGHSLRAALAFACASFAMCPVLIACASEMMRSPPFRQAAEQAWSAAQQAAIAAGTVGLLFSVAEFGAARSAWLRKLRMSFEDRKREHKEEEGDAIARGRRRSLHRALLRGGMGRIEEAAFVVANPTHVAVALAYSPPHVAIPEVVVRAADEAALRVREMAARYRIPIVHNVWLARALYRDARSGEPIPHAHYVAVAEVVAALMRSNELAR
jgi:flagellar biosynthesis protein FlhB